MVEIPLKFWDPVYLDHSLDGALHPGRKLTEADRKKVEKRRDIEDIFQSHTKRKQLLPWEKGAIQQRDE